MTSSPSSTYQKLTNATEQGQTGASTEGYFIPSIKGQKVTIYRGLGAILSINISIN